MENHNILAIGTSTGGVEALRFLAKGFPPDFEASVFVTIHLSSRFESILDKILARAGPLAAGFATDGETIQKSRIYIAPPERHLIIDGDRLWLGNGPRENSARPAIDPMLRSAALCCAARAIGVVLTGALGDGASGLWALKHAGGITVVQDPSDARQPEMPQTALSRTKPDHVVRLADLPGLLVHLVRQPAGKPRSVPGWIAYDVEMARNGGSKINLINKVRQMDQIGRRSVLACPDCGGVMWEIDEGDLTRFRCHVGHALTAEMMSLALDENLKRALASALRILEERVALSQSLQDQAIKAGWMTMAEIWAERAQEYEHEANVLRSSMRRMDQLAAEFAKNESRNEASVAPGQQ